jgi:hypothetical protein
VLKFHSRMLLFLVHAVLGVECRTVHLGPGYERRVVRERFSGVVVRAVDVFVFLCLN